MKLKASAQMPEEAEDYQDLKAYIKARHPGARVRESTARPPQKVLFVTTGKSRKSKNTKILSEEKGNEHER